MNIFLKLSSTDLQISCKRQTQIFQYFFLNIFHDVNGNPNFEAFHNTCPCVVGEKSSAMRGKFINKYNMDSLEAGALANAAGV